MELTHIGTVASISFKRELIYIHTYNIAYLKGIDVLIGMCWRMALIKGFEEMVQSLTKKNLILYGIRIIIMIFKIFPFKDSHFHVYLLL